MSEEVAGDAAPAVGRLLLPAVRISAGNNAKQLEKRFSYLWQAAHASIATCAPAAHQMIASMVQSARVNRVVLPAEVLDFVCERCAGLLVPTISADVRVVPLATKAAANRKLAQQRRRAKRSKVVAMAPEVVTNAMRVTCRRCKHANLRAAATVVNKPKSKKSRNKKCALDEDSEDSKAQDDKPPASKRAKVGDDGEKQAVAASKLTAPLTSAASTSLKPAKPQQVQPPAAFRSVLAPPAPLSPPRKLLDGPKRKKKKKSAGVDPVASAAKSSLNSFLRSLRPGTST